MIKVALRLFELLRIVSGGVVRFRQDQPAQSKENSRTRTTTENIIRQIGSTVEVGRFNGVRPDIVRTLPCESNESARKLALELSGAKITADERKQHGYVKLNSHPWYGTVLLEELTEKDRNFIALFIRKNSDVSAEDFNLKVHKLFLDDPKRPLNHALTQEVLQVLAHAENHYE